MKRKKLSIEEKWHEQAEAFRCEAEQLSYGSKEREELLRKATLPRTSMSGYRRRA